MARQRHKATRQILQAMQDGLSIESIYLEVFQPVQYEVGRLWQMNQLTVAQELRRGYTLRGKLLRAALVALEASDE